MTHSKSESFQTFAEANLFQPIKRALAEQQYERPTPIQAQTIPPAIDGADILGCAQTGTGKTAAFALPILDFLGHEPCKAMPKRPVALVLAPTRELAIQISESFDVYGKHVDFHQALVYGGVGQSPQVKALRRGVHVLIATPGRLLDLMEQGYIDLADVDQFVLDEADRMLDMGFLPALKQIIAQLPKDRQSMFFSATMPPEILALAQQLLTNPVCVNVTPKQKSVKQIDQTIRLIERPKKVEELTYLLGRERDTHAIVFTRTKRGADILVRKLDRGGIRAAAIHGNKSQGARQRSLDAFRRRRVKVLVATDVAARGIDIDGVTHVINYDMPNDPESYVHRVGRTGRAGAEGTAISFCTPHEFDELRAIEKLIGERLQIDNPDGVVESKEPRPKKPRQSRSSSSQSRHSRPKQKPSGETSRPKARTKKPFRGKKPAHSSAKRAPARAGQR